MKINLIEKFIGSGFFTGYIPFASGTWASLAALLIYWIPGFESYFIILPAIALSVILGIYLGSKFEILYGKDPAQCTIDEVAGMWISLLFLPKSLIISISAFFIWRALDIIKPFPARRLENLHGGLGVMMDDIVSSIYALGIIHLIVYIFK
jgi:phosphatidylglycerophosphatase A